MAGKLRVGVGLLTLSVLFAFAATAESVEISDFLDYSLLGGEGDVLLGGRLFVPPDPVTPRPLILYLHGAGAVGVDNSSQVGGLDNLLAEAKRRGALLYAPQTSQGWSDNILDRTTLMIEQAIDDFQVDASRLYVTGYSLGGGGTWNMLSRHPSRFAAAVPIAGVAPRDTFDADNLIDQSVWVFHARNDAIVIKDISRDVVNSILSAAGEPTLTFPPDDDPNIFEFIDDTPDLRYTEWPTGGHGILPRVHSTPEMYDWLFAHETVPSSEFILSPRISYAAIDSDPLFDALGDDVEDGAGVAGRLIGDLDGSSRNELGRVIAKFNVPDMPPGPVLESATLRFYLLANTGPPTGSLSLFHSSDDNDLDQLASDYEDTSYKDTLLDLIQPTDATGAYYEVEVTDFVRADYATDGDDVLSAFRLQMDGATFVEDGQGHGYVVTLPGAGANANRPQLILTFVPEPSSLILAILGVAAFRWRPRIRPEPKR